MDEARGLLFRVFDCCDVPYVKSGSGNKCVCVCVFGSCVCRYIMALYSSACHAIIKSSDRMMHTNISAFLPALRVKILAPQLHRARH